MPLNHGLSTLLVFVAVCLCGCAEGQFWKTGKYAPWVQERWAAEEEIADTLFARKARMSQAVASVANAPVEQQQQVATKLSEVILRDPVLLLRLHSLKLITSLNCPKTLETLTVSASDPSSEIRIATVKALEKIGSTDALYQLQEVVANDSDDDVRIAATKALGSFRGQQSVQALAIALTDRNPALQICATESLAQATGNHEIGRDVVKWRNLVQQKQGSSAGSGTKPQPKTGTPVERVAGSGNRLAY